MSRCFNRVGVLIGCILFAVTLQMGISTDVQAGDAKAVYGCAACSFQQADQGTCPKCNAPLKKWKVTYDCSSCGMPQNDPGNCSMCGVALKEKKTPVTP